MGRHKKDACRERSRGLSGTRPHCLSRCGTEVTSVEVAWTAVVSSVVEETSRCCSGVRTTGPEKKKKDLWAIQSRSPHLVPDMLASTAARLDPVLFPITLQFKVICDGRARIYLWQRVPLDAAERKPAIAPQPLTPYVEEYMSLSALPQASQASSAGARRRHPGWARHNEPFLYRYPSRDTTACTPLPRTPGWLCSLFTQIDGNGTDRRWGVRSNRDCPSRGGPPAAETASGLLGDRRAPARTQSLSNSNRWAVEFGGCPTPRPPRHRTPPPPRHTQTMGNGAPTHGLPPALAGERTRKRRVRVRRRGRVWRVP